MSINIKIFDPFTDVLASDERLKIIDGQLTMEKSEVRREKMTACARFWTRGQYSQTAILKKMGQIFRESKLNDKSRQTFLNNFEQLKVKAEQQNKDFKDVNPILRFFEAKSFIDITAFSNEIQEIDTKFLKAKSNDQSQVQFRESLSQNEKALKQAAIREAEFVRNEKINSIKHEMRILQAEIIEIEKPFKPSKEEIQAVVKESAQKNLMTLERAEKIAQFRYQESLNAKKMNLNKLFEELQRIS
jgi:hypothetical protein